MRSDPSFPVRSPTLVKEPSTSVLAVNHVPPVIKPVDAVQGRDVDYPLKCVVQLNISVVET